MKTENTDRPEIPEWLSSFRPTALREKRYRRYLERMERSHMAKDEDDLTQEDLDAYFARCIDRGASGLTRQIVNHYAEREPKAVIFCECGRTFTVDPNTCIRNAGPFLCVGCKRWHSLPVFERMGAEVSP